jgi:hypothetical protein
MSATKLIIATSAILAVAATLAAGEPRKATDITSNSVAALKTNVVNPAGLVVDEVRVTDDGVACIEYRVNSAKDGKSRGHAVVQGDDVLKSTADYNRFDKAWNEHCLGPRGGMTSDQ